LKPVQRRILYQMAEMGLRPERGHVKSARVVGEVMGRLHPHGDSAIYDALVRMAQPFSLRLPLIDGHGNFGSLDDGPAAMRYTECRLAPAAETLTTSMHEDTVDYAANYDGREREPVVLPAAVPMLLVNGASGIAVGMATNMAPHNLGEVCAAAKALLRKPRSSLEDVMVYLPGPDLPTGAQILGLDGIKDAYATGKGAFRMRAATRIEQVSARRKGIVIAALPLGVGPERIIEKVKELVIAKKIDGIRDIVDLTDGEHGLQLSIEIKNGFSPEAVRDKLFRLTPLEDSFNVNSVALVDGQPRTLGLLEMLRVFLDHRIEVLTRRSEFRRTKALDRLHLVEGLLIATLNIDEVVAVIRASDDATIAKARLMTVFDLSEIQATHILDMPLRRLTKFSLIELESEQATLADTIAKLTEILDDPKVLKKLLITELDEAAAAHTTPRRSVLLDGPIATALAPDNLEIPDEPCRVVLTSSGLLARTNDATAIGGEETGSAATAIGSIVAGTTRGSVAVVTSKGRAHRVDITELPMTSTGNSVGGAPVKEYCSLERGEKAVGLMPLSQAVEGGSAAEPSSPNSEPPSGSAMVVPALATAQGVVKRLNQEDPGGKDIWDVIALKPGDRVIAATTCRDDDELVFISSDAQLLRIPASAVRAQGRSAGGMAGMRLAADAQVVFFGAVAGNDSSAVVVTVAGGLGQLAGTSASSVKVSAFDQFPSKGRATGGVRCQRLVKGEDALVLAWAGSAPPRAESPSGKPVELPSEVRARDASGDRVTKPIGSLGGPL
ncbi:MAG: DNA topoisomerase IV subunit A, partial [Actinobacteria bacterium]|nr:DNA topoisomerase IV subunit A [Actinomycetota bacterium]